MQRRFIFIHTKKLEIILRIFLITLKVDPLICFSVKSNSNVLIISELGKLGSGADVVSKGELIKALKAKIKPNRIVFSGVGKTEEELLHAIKKKSFVNKY